MQAGIHTPLLPSGGEHARAGIHTPLLTYGGDRGRRRCPSTKRKPGAGPHSPGLAGPRLNRSWAACQPELGRVSAVSQLDDLWRFLLPCLVLCGWVLAASGLMTSPGGTGRAGLGWAGLGQSGAGLGWGRVGQSGAGLGWGRVGQKGLHDGFLLDLFCPFWVDFAMEKADEYLLFNVGKMISKINYLIF